MPDSRWIDGRNMLPPEPLERAVAELGSLASDEELVMLLYCEPLPLYAILDREGFRYECTHRADGCHEIHINKT